MSSCTVEQVVGVAPAHTWYQLYGAKEPAQTDRLVHPDDAQAALQAGADAVTVSNHGGNKLDRMRASVEDLPGVVERVGGNGQIFFDGGIRRGSDIVMAAALGAQFSFVGRATLYGVGAGGSEGALRAIDILRSGIDYTMAMIGCKTVSDIGPGHVASAA